MTGNGTKKKLAESSSRLVAAVELARKVSRPLTFFAAMGFLLIGLIPVLYAMTPDKPTLELAVPLALVCLALPVDIVCVLFWAKAKLAKDPNAFKDES